MFPIRMSVGAPVALITTLNIENSTHSGAAKMYLLHEALSKTRMRRPQAGTTTSTEATRSARNVALESRRRAARELGTR
ncbi:hypothetical protein GCM10027290_57930 [Micromonospora sonneratiae]